MKGLSNVAWTDANGDGLPDLNVAANDDGSQGILLFYNNGDGTFTQTTGGAGAMYLPGVWTDFDNDGDQDWYSALAGGHLARNDGSGFFTWLPGSESPDFPYQAESMVWADFDGDAYLDIYCPGWESPSFEGYPDGIFYNNDGNGTFAWSWTSPPVTYGNNDYRSGRSATAADFDEDGDMDVYVSNYRLGYNNLYRNDGSGVFSDVAAAYGVDDDDYVNPYQSAWPGDHTIASCWGDMDNDGHFDLLVGNFAHAEAHQGRPQFHRNMGPGGSWYFENKTSIVGLPYVESHASPSVADIDNDGDLDYFITAVGGSYAGDYSTLMRNDGNWTFTDVSDDANLEITTTTYANFHAAWADYDDDGDLDLFTARKLYRNTLDNTNHWLKVRLVGDGVNINRDAIGAQVRINIAGLGTLTRQRETATGWGNENFSDLHFGLGSESGPVTLEIVWPDGFTQQKAVDVDQTVVVAYDLYGAHEREDIVVFNPSTGIWSGSHTAPALDYITGDTNTQSGAFGSSADTPLLGDVDGDGLDDIVYVHPAGNYNWYASHTTDNDSNGAGELPGGTEDSSLIGFGTVAGSLDNFLGDVDGNGTDDAITVNSGFNWYAKPSGSDGLGTGGALQGPAQWGLAGDQPVVGDFDGDGYDDVAVYRVAGGNIFWKSSAGGVIGAGAQGPIGQIGGFAGQDSLIACSLNGDAYDDAVMVRQDATGLMTWYGLINDGTGFLDYFNPGTTIVDFGLDDGGSTPIVADINGDGRADIGYIRDNGSGLVWRFAFTSSAGSLSSYVSASGTFGSSGDVPLIGQLNYFDLRISGFASDPGGFVIEWEPSIPGRLYTVNWSTNLATNFMPLATGIEAPQNSYTDTVHDAEDQCFYTVEAQ